MMKVDFYQPLNKSLQQVGALMDIAEAHGILCGMLCASPHDTSYECWIKHVLGESSGKDLLAEEAQQQLIALREYTQHQLNADNFEFSLLIPQDDEPLYTRTQALSGWCEGFIFGLSLAGLHDIRQFEENIQDFIKDVLNISHLAPLTTSTEEDEAAYMELVEYIRIGVSNFYETAEENIQLPTMPS
ncbi:yecA family protein [Beggiatoa alba B18LD]|uniref:YecA family protein n=1 Tax=Beggiatoa alba B18LD TaxID=395493 RepID=I3CG64_9GAMM|nr:UPF0149 family protein [Beggiatoa alba]EIJ42607.1 yecA family protein [Beggiatoa alba B18LD]